ncbi:uncharacterized protein F5147DRAFT_657166 [Suillus discolor]|uniref:Uncharacterized protein n=1 Tax=Suillus discolor TaxID=1912936 RepID=A0A9P7EXE2_9AGAM|nr:uncharacterized protein F5147DRAFT_657166 [Suillus discolor]KAG2094401.1 hypothetical protein F5147DRAFT_657166 [Suillus discolor]
MSKERAMDDDDEDLARSIFQLTLEHRTQNWRVSEAKQVASRSTSDDTTRASRERSVVIQDQESEDYRRLYLLDIELHARLRGVTNTVNKLDSSDGQQVLTMLTEECNWMKKAQEENCGMHFFNHCMRLEMQWGVS